MFLYEPLIASKRHSTRRTQAHFSAVRRKRDRSIRFGRRSHLLSV